MFAKWFGVSTRTVEAWESGRNKSSGSSSRLLSLLQSIAKAFNRCYELRCYSIFVHQVRQEISSGVTLFAAIKSAIRYCETHNLMVDYFKANEQEVFDMVSFKWDNQRALEIAHEEAKQETRCEVALDMLKHNFPLNLVASISKLSLEQLRKMAQAHHLTVTEG